MGRKKIVETSAEKSSRAHLAIMMRAGRTALGFSQREFGELVGVHYSSLARFETGQLRLKQVHIETMLKVLENSGLQIEISKDSGINIQIPPHILGAMEAIEGIKMSADFYQAADLVGL
jgi:transcriptional regulator with XRE-family HTH domain